MRSTSRGWRRRWRRPPSRPPGTPTSPRTPSSSRATSVRRCSGVANTGREDAIRYLLDPRVVPGTRWITGANQPGRHVFDLVAGRDFVGDGTVEAAEVRAGDPAPDGSGPLELARGIEIGHIFALGRKYADALGLSGPGRERQGRHGDDGLVRHRRLPRGRRARRDQPRRRRARLAGAVAPAHVHLVATGKDEAVRARATSSPQTSPARASRCSTTTGRRCRRG